MNATTSPTATLRGVARGINRTTSLSTACLSSSASCRRAWGAQTGAWAHAGALIHAAHHACRRHYACMGGVMHGAACCELTWLRLGAMDLPAKAITDVICLLYASWKRPKT